MTYLLVHVNPSEVECNAEPTKNSQLTINFGAQNCTTEFEPMHAGKREAATAF